ncbi:MAG: ribosome silencing factor, partial [Acinetobacter sp.]
ARKFYDLESLWRNPTDTDSVA